MEAVTIGNLKGGSLNSGVDGSTETIISLQTVLVKSYSSTINLVTMLKLSILLRVVLGQPCLCMKKLGK